MKVHTKRRRAGFSLTEMLVVVGIIAILLGIGVPSILYYQRELKLTELDDNARAVFIAAQNNLTALRSASAGELEVSSAVGRNAKEAGTASSLAGTELMYVSTHDGNTGWLVLPGSIESDLAEGSYLVEFEPTSGTVYGVFFLEKGTRELDESTYGTICSNSCRSREGRKAFSKAAGGFYVGYYGSDGALDMTRPDSQKLPKPKLTLINAEELVLKIDTDAASWPTTIDQTKVYVNVSISGVAEPLVDKGAIRSGAGGTVVLDTLKASGYNTNKTQSTPGWTVGAPFAQWMADGSGGYIITPGVDITVNVFIGYDGEGVVALPQSASVTTNSLFAARTKSGETVSVAYGRHLQNLTSTSHLDSAITAAVQMKKIDFGKTGGDVYSWADTYPGRKFASISNSNLKGYNGQSQTIQNMDATAMPYAGLFSSVTDMTLENIVLVDAKVNGGGSAGGLAGMAKDTKVENCQVYLDAPYSGVARIKSSGTAGGLIGVIDNFSTNVTIENSFASTVIEGNPAGGLVGRGTNFTVKNSYAASHLSGSQAGGLVGGLWYNNSPVTIQNSYAAGMIAQATSEAAGLVVPHSGTTVEHNRITIQNSYAAVDYGENVPTSDKVYGVAPVGSCTNVSYLAKAGVNDAVTVPNVTVFNSTEAMHTSAALGLGTPFIDGENAAVKAYPYNLVTRTAEEGPLEKPYPYPTLRVKIDETWVSVPHYGDWLEAMPPSAFLAYFEQYADGTYGYQYPTDSGEENTLRDDKGALRNEGYALIGKEDPKEVKIAGADVSWTKHTETYTDAAGETYNIYILGTDLAQKRHTQAPARYTDGSMPADYGGYCELTVDGGTIWFNPDFAKTTSLTKPATSARATEYIRSIRHFNNMRRYNSSKPDVWVQELDLDGAVYEGYQAVDGSVASMAVTTAADGSRHMVMDTITMVSSTALKDSWGAEYDGGGHAIRHMDIKPVTGVGSKSADQNRTYAGLFGRTIDAEVKNLTVEHCNITGKKLGSGDSYTGALVGYNEVPVENCYAVNCTVTSEGGYVGGLLGAARQGTATHCGVRALNAADYDRYTVSGGAYAGGLVGYEWDAAIEYCYAAVKVSGENAGGFAGRIEGAGSIKNSYAGGHTVSGDYQSSAPNVSGTKMAGGFAGKRNGSKLVTLENVYTTCSVGVPKGKTVDVFAPEVATTPGGFAYAVGDVFVDGKAVKAADHNKAGVKFRPAYPSTKAVAYPYDTTLSAQYFYQPVTKADGTLMDHYGDWCENTSTRTQREWEQQLVESKPKDYENVETNVALEDGKIHIEYIMDNTGQGWDATRVGPSGDGVFCISTDLNYMLMFRFVNENGEKKVIGGSGAEGFTFAFRYVDKDGNTVPKELGDSDITAYDKIVWDVYVDSSELPPYVSEIRVGAAENNYQAVLPMPEGGVPPKDMDGTISVDDGSFDDWIGYEHQVYEGFPGNQGTPLYGHWTASMLGYENKIYLHVIDENPADIPNYATPFNNVSFFSFANVKVTTEDGTEQSIGDWWRLNSETERILDTGEMQKPAYFPETLGEYNYRFHSTKYDYSSWPPIVLDEYDIMRWFLRLEDGRVEYELEIDLDSIAKEYLGLENADTITDFQLNFNRGIIDYDQLKILEVKREPKKTEP